MSRGGLCRYTFYFSTFLKQILKIAKNIQHWSSSSTHIMETNLTFILWAFFFIQLLLFSFFWTRWMGLFWCHALNDRYWRLSTTSLTSPRLVVLFLIATRLGRDQIWPIIGETYRLGSLATSAEVLWKKCQVLFIPFPLGHSSNIEAGLATCNLCTCIVHI